MKKKEKNIFIVTIAFMLIVLALMVTFNFVSFYKSAVSDMESIANNTLSAEVSEIQSYISQDENTLRVTSDNLEFMIENGGSTEDIERCLKYVTKKFQLEIDENFTGVYGYLNGEYIDGSDWIPPSDYEPKTRDWYVKAAQANGDIIIVPPYVDAETGDVIISVSRMLDDNDSVISLDIKLNHVQEIVEKMNMDGKGYAFVFDTSGLVIAHNDINEVGKNYLTDTDMAEIIVKAKEGKSFSSKVDGEKSEIFTAKANDSWRTVMIVSDSKFLKSSRDLLVKNILIVIVVYATVIFFSIFAFKKLKESIEEVNRSHQEIESANKSLEHSKDVINKIAYTNIITDLKNRYSLENDIKGRLASEYINIAFFDIDNFRSINETFGYDFGDNLLADIAQQFVEKFSQYAEIYNIFGNEFCLVFKKEVTQKQAEEVVNQAFETIKDKYLIGNIYVQVNASGIFYKISPKEFNSASALLVKIESIVRDIKRNGGNYCMINTN